MSPEIILLYTTAATIAFVHTILGPDHYLPFVAMAKASKWNMSKTLKVVLICGLGHIVGSIVLGLFGVLVGSQLSSLVNIETWRGDIAAWGLITVGLVYFVWGMRRAMQNKPHTHIHVHDGIEHSHEHTHQTEHAHVHTEEVEQSHSPKASKVFSPWAIFIIFVLGPCEPLIPLLMYPAATDSMFSVVMVATIFGLVTMLTMLMAVMAALWSLQFFKFPKLERFSHAIMGSTILMCGVSITAFGL